MCDCRYTLLTNLLCVFTICWTKWYNHLRSSRSRARLREPPSSPLHLPAVQAHPQGHGLCRWRRPPPRPHRYRRRRGILPLSVSLRTSLASLMDGDASHACGCCILRFHVRLQGQGFCGKEFREDSGTGARRLERIWELGFLYIDTSLLRFDLVIGMDDAFVALGDGCRTRGGIWFPELQF